MEQFLQAVGAVFFAVVLSLTLGKQAKDMAALLALGACAMVLLVGVSYLRPVMDFIRQLETMGNLSGDLIGCLMKVVGIAILSEIAALVCADAGNASLGKALQVLASMVVLWLSIPVFSAVMDLVQRMMGSI